MTDSLVQHYLDRHAEKLDTRAVRVERGAIDRCYDLLADQLADGPWLVAYDADTWEAAGEQFVQVLEAAGRDWHGFELEAEPGHDYPICTDAVIDECQAAMMEHGCAAGIAVGSGTINDTVKMAAHNLDRPMGVVGTAPSMNGYTSGISAILSDGVKTTNPCTAPRVVIADLDVMAEAPQRMICSGLGDLMSKPVSNSDWALSARLNGTAHSAEAMEIIEEGAAALEGVAPKLPERDREAMRGLVQSLMLSGIAMSVAGSSSPASGGEHLVSHYIDMTAHAYDKPYDFHGCQVGVGTLVSSYLWQKLSEYDPSDLDIEARVEQLEPWEAYEERLRERFGPVFEAVVTHAEPGYPSEEELRGRLEQLVDQWDEALEEASRTLRTPDSLEAELASAECPTRFADLDVDRDRALRSMTHAKDIRNRYTILHACWELGTLEEWAAEALERFYT